MTFAKLFFTEINIFFYRNKYYCIDVDFYLLEYMYFVLYLLATVHKTSRSIYMVNNPKGGI